MAIRKSMEECICVEGNRYEWLQKVNNALSVAGFTNVVCESSLFQVKGNYKKVTIWGEILIILVPFGNDNNKTELNIRSTAHVDNIYALFKSPNKTIIEKFKSAIDFSKLNNLLTETEEIMEKSFTDCKMKNILLICPHCKNPNTKKLLECEWCGNKIC